MRPLRKTRGEDQYRERGKETECSGHLVILLGHFGNNRKRRRYFSPRGIVSIRGQSLVHIVWEERSVCKEWFQRRWRWAVHANLSGLLTIASPRPHNKVPKDTVSSNRMLHIRPMNAEDVPRGMELKDQAGWNQGAPVAAGL